MMDVGNLALISLVDGSYFNFFNPAVSRIISKALLIVSSRPSLYILFRIFCRIGNFNVGVFIDLLS